MKCLSNVIYVYVKILESFLTRNNSISITQVLEPIVKGVCFIIFILFVHFSFISLYKLC